MKHATIIFVAFLIGTLHMFGQKMDPETSPPNRIEKVYVHTDRPFYFPGETIWFKSYITNAHQEVTTLSDVAYVELISPEGSVVKTNDYRIVNGYIYGEFALNTSWLGGIYTLKAYTRWMKNNGEQSLFTKKITVQKVVQPRLQMKFDFKKEAYGPGSIVQATLKLEDLENNLLSDQLCTYTLRIDGKVETTKTQQTNASGVLDIQFKLPTDLKTVDAVVNVTTDHGGHTESISRSVPVTLDNIDLQLLPEGGILLGGYKNTVAFKAMNAYGKPADVSGYIKNEKNQVVANFNSYHNGMGSFILNPQNGATYTAHITEPFQSQKTYVLPTVAESGINLHIDQVTETDVFVTINSTVQTAIELCASDVQETLYNTSEKLKKGTQKLKIPISDFPKGITKITVQSQQGDHLVERLVFAHYDQKLSIDIKTDKESYATQEKVDVLITTKDHKGNSVPANLSIAVVDNKLLSFADDRQDTIESYFLMSSELQGNIYKPSFYFNPKEEKAREALDFLLLTHGWRSYLTDPTIDILTAVHKPEQLSLQSGTVVNMEDKPTKAKLLLFDVNSDSVLPIETDDNGNFIFKMGEQSRKTLIAYNDAGDKLQIKLDKNNTAYSRKSYRERREAEATEALVEDAAEEQLMRPMAATVKQKVAKVANAPSKPASVALKADNNLDEVVVTAQGIRREKRALGYAVSEVAAEEIASITEGDVARVLSGKAAGVAITSQSGNSGAASNIVIRGYNSINGSNQALFIVDGISFDQTTATSDNRFLDIDPSHIESVNVIKGLAAATLFGTEGRNGVIVITTKNYAHKNTSGAKKLFKRKYKNYTVEYIYNFSSRSFTPSASFYIPKYDSAPVSQERTDFRQTIYWNPVVQTDKNGIATLSYYNSDATTSFAIIAEGVDPTGQVAHKEQSYSVIKLLSIDFKMPAYMSVDDAVVLPITIKNTTRSEIKGELDIVLPEEFAFAKTVQNSLRGAYQKQSIKIPANGFKVIPVTIIPKKQVAETTIKVNIIAENDADFLTRKTTVVSPYFPTEASVSGFENSTFELPIDNLVTGTLRADFNVYTDVVGDVMDGVESLIRKPYGCFEQTSSSTYPNVMVLKYLQESGKSNTAIEQKALGFIREGYKRLISFETKERGFEWFGKTPPHETLTAFGVLEFTEMKEVYPEVSQAMIDRTVDWLMSRRDGEGGFYKSKKGYDSFASSPQDVANAYIVYALSASKVKADFTKEYEAAFKDALQSKDSYKMAMMACAASELERSNDLSTLLEHIKVNIATHGFKELPVKNTITRSYGQDKQTETLAFTILALLAEKTSSEVLIANAVKALTSSRKHGRFGATQATAMSLKALIAYTKTQKQKLIQSEDAITVTINGKGLNKKMTTSTSGKIHIKDIATHLKEGNNQIKVHFSNEKNTFPYSLNLNWSSTLPTSATDCPLELRTITNEATASVGDNIRHTTTVTNTQDKGLGMVTAIIGLPSGASSQPWQLKELIEKEKVAFYEVFDNYVVFYWRSFDAQETKTIHLDLKAEIAGKYTAPASCAYLYYGEEFKIWKKGVRTEIL